MAAASSSRSRERGSEAPAAAISSHGMPWRLAQLRSAASVSALPEATARWIRLGAGALRAFSWRIAAAVLLPSAVMAGSIRRATAGHLARTASDTRRWATAATLTVAEGG